MEYGYATPVPFFFQGCLHLHVMYHLMLQCETRNVKVSFAERFSRSEDGELLDR
jgi:hypothetical protein